MNRLVTFFRHLRLDRILSTIALSIVLCWTSAYPPAIAGAIRSEHYDLFTDLNAALSASLVKPIETNLTHESSLIREINQQGASNIIANNFSEKASSRLTGVESEPRNVGVKKEALQKVDPIPAQRQKVIDRSDPNEKILEKIEKQFEDAGKLLKEPTNPPSQKFNSNINSNLNEAE